MTNKQRRSRTVTLLLLASLGLSSVQNLVISTQSGGPDTQEQNPLSVVGDAQRLYAPPQELSASLRSYAAAGLAAPSHDDLGSISPNAPLARITEPEAWGDEPGGGGFEAIFLPENMPSLNPTVKVWEPELSRFEPSIRILDPNLGNGNFTFSIPLVNLPGRGPDLALSLHYHSRVWYRGREGNVTTMYYGKGSGWVAPGWSMGFPSLARVVRGSRIVYMIVDGDGTRHEFGGSRATGFYTTDGTLISYDEAAKKAIYPNGTVITFGAYVGYTGRSYATRITDPSGNFISISYLDNRGPHISEITDTLGRTFRFHYDFRSAYDWNSYEEGVTLPLLTAIDGPGLDGEERRTLIRLHYKELVLSADFAPGIDSVPDTSQQFASVYLPDAIYYPADQTGYWFGDADSFSSYGMLRKVSQRRAMTFTPGWNYAHMGSVGSGIMTRERLYNYPLEPDPNNLPDNAPRFTTMTERWELTDTSPSVTTFQMHKIGSTQVMTVTYPSGTRQVQHSVEGRPTRTETFRDGLSKTSVVNYESGFRGSKRPSGTHITDELGQTTAISYTYGAQFDQMLFEDYYGYYSGNNQPVLLKRIRTEYVNEQAYLARNILNLPRAVSVESPPGTRVSLTEFGYDGYGDCLGVDCSLSNTPGVVQHDPRYNPYNVFYVPYSCEEECVTYEFRCRMVCQGPPRDQNCWEECDEQETCSQVCGGGYWERQYDTRTLYRGNVTQIATYANAADRAGPVVQSLGYDITGNVVTSTLTSAIPNQQTTYSYTAQTQFAYPSAVTVGSATDPNLRLTTTTTYDFNTGLPRSVTDANNMVAEMNYDRESLRLSQTGVKRAGHGYDTHTTYNYNYDGPAGEGFLTTRTTHDDVTQTRVGESIERLNGLGLTRHVQTRAEGEAWNISEIQYDQLGRVWKASRPYRTGQPVQWSENTYDGLSRVTAVRAPDNSVTRIYYNQPTRPSAASSELGATIRTEDAWGRQRWSLYNALGLLVQVVEPNPDGSGNVLDPGHLVTSYQYDGNNNLALVVQGDQQRKFCYDSLGRLTHQHLPERNATLSNQACERSGWSDVFTYDDASNLASHTDARGIRTNYHYNGDPLNRLQSVTYDMGGFSDTGNPVLPAANVTFDYMTTGDKTRLRQTTAGSGSNAVIEAYDYDDRARLRAKTNTFAWRAAFPQVVDYSYDGAGRLRDLTYPAEYGIPGQPRKVMHLDYDVASRVSRLTMDGTDYASGFVYNEASQVTSLLIGAVPRQLRETYDYAPETGLLTNQQVLSGTTPLLNFSYDYVKPGGGGQTGDLTRLTNNLDLDKSASYEYDALGRLKQMKRGADPNAYLWRQTYGYDRYGNRESVAVDPPGSVVSDGIPSLAYDTSNNRITTPGYEYEYDAAGNLTCGPGLDGTWQRYQYDAAGRLVRVRHDTQSDVTLEAYSYGAGRERLISQQGHSPEARTYYAWSGGTVIAEYTDVGTGPRIRTLSWSRSYVYLGSRLLATLTKNGTAAAVKYHHADRLGTRLITSADSMQVWEQETLPFGTALQVSAGSRAGNRVFTSYDRSESVGVDYAMNRFYDSQLGRFTQVDPIGAGASTLDNPQTFNLFAYVGGNPVNYTDPTGLRSCDPEVESCASYDWTPADLGMIFAGASTLYPYQYAMQWYLAVGLNPQEHMAILERMFPSQLAVDQATPDLSGIDLSSVAQGEGFYIGKNVVSSITSAEWFTKELIGCWESCGGHNGTMLAYSGLEFLIDTSNFAAGFGDMISLGATEWVRTQQGSNDVVKKDSPAYTAGSVAGAVNTIAVPALRGGAALGGTQTAVGRWLNTGPNWRLGPGRMPANGLGRAGTHVPRLSIGRGPGNPHRDLRVLGK